MSVLPFPAQSGCFSQMDLQQVSLLAEGLSRQEVADYMTVDLNSLSSLDIAAFDRAYKHGRAKAIYFAYTKLKEATSGRNGHQAALALLNKFADEFSMTNSFKLD